MITSREVEEWLAIFQERVLIKVNGEASTLNLNEEYTMITPRYIRCLAITYLNDNFQIYKMLGNNTSE